MSVTDLLLRIFGNCAQKVIEPGNPSSIVDFSRLFCRSVKNDSPLGPNINCASFALSSAAKLFDDDLEALLFIDGLDLPVLISFNSTTFFTSKVISLFNTTALNGDFSIVLLLFCLGGSHPPSLNSPINPVGILRKSTFASVPMSPTNLLTSSSSLWPWRI